MNELSLDGQDPVPEPHAALTRRILIRPTKTGWSLEDERREVGGLFTTLDAALAFARREQLHGAGAIRIEVAAHEAQRHPQLRAA